MDANSATNIQIYCTSPTCPVLFCIAKADDTGQRSGRRSQLELKPKPAVFSGSCIFIFFPCARLKIEICFTYVISLIKSNGFFFFFSRRMRCEEQNIAHNACIYIPLKVL